jgi:transposase
VAHRARLPDVQTRPTRPVYHHKRESIDAHLAVVFALDLAVIGHWAMLTALAISHRIEARTGWTIKKFVRALRRYRTVKINTGSHTLAAEDRPPDDVRQALAAIHQGAH